MTGQFNNVTLRTNADLIEVTGPLRIDNDPAIDGKIESAVIHFLIVQGRGNDTVTAIGQGHWARPAGNWTAELPADAGKHPDGTDGTFSTNVDNGTARGIALAIAIKPGEVSNGTFVPPSFQALTWCADFKFVPESAA